MKNPILRYLKNVFASQRVLGTDNTLDGLVKADALLQALVADKQVPGLSITVLKDGKAILQKGYGYANLEDKLRVDPKNTIFRIASVSKPIAATALAHMVADGVIALDASFYDYVPYYPKKEWDFTIGQLASHTAGIRSYRGKEFGLNKPYSIKESTEVFKEDSLLFEPGTAYEYTSFDWVLISLAMQEASGIPFEDYVFEKVIKPLGMLNTFAPKQFLEDKTPKTDTFLNAEKQKNCAAWYTKVRSGFREAIPVNNFYKLAGGGYLSTSEDIARFGQTILDGTNLNLDIQTEFLTAVRVNEKPTYYGLGWQVSEDKQGRPYFGHVGSSVGAYSNFFVYPEQGMVFSILVNCTDPKVQDVLDLAIDSLLDTKRVV